MLMTGEKALPKAAGSAAPGVGRVFAIANQKGGVGKTTTAINLGTAMASVGRRVLVIDLDPQGNASTGLGFEVVDRRSSTYDVLHGEMTIAEAALMSQKVPNLYVAPSTRDLSGADAELMQERDGRFRLRNALWAHRDTVLEGDKSFDYVLIDCPPSLNLLTVNALTASDGVIVPLQCEFFALEGLSQLINTIHRIRKSLNQQLGVQGVVLTMFDKRHRSCVEVGEEARQFLGDLVYETVIPRNVKLAEAPSHGLPALMYDYDSPGSQAYIALATEVLARENDPVA